MFSLFCFSRRHCFLNGGDHAKHVRVIPYTVPRNPSCEFAMTKKVLLKPELDALTMRFKEVEPRFGSDFHNRHEEFVERFEGSFEIKDKGGV